MIPSYQYETNITEADCMLVLLEWARGDEQRLMAIDNDCDLIVLNAKRLGAKHFGKLQAAMVLYRMIEKGYYP